MNDPVRIDRRGVERFRPVVAGLAVVLMLAGAGCASQSRAQFACDAQINDGILLAIDLIEVTEEEIKQIQDAGDDWFTSPIRDQLRHRIKTISVRGGCDEVVDLTSLTSSEKILRKKKGYGTLAIIAEYDESRGDRDLSNMQFRSRKQWKGKTTLVRVHSDYLTIEGSR